jgi:hypothetical protein
MEWQKQKSQISQPTRKKIAKRNLHTIKIIKFCYTLDDNQKYSEKINKHYFACGCETGTYFMVIAILFTILFSTFRFIFKDTSLLWSIIYSAIFVLIFSITGKLIGLLFAKINLFRTKKK